LNIQLLLHLIPPQRTCRQLRHSLATPDGSVITNLFQKQWGNHFAVWQPLFAVANASTRLKTAAVCDKLAAMCGCWTLSNFEGAHHFFPSMNPFHSH
jgi:hypothetical protein